jgi:putative tricarboxylic transport membrane protein
MNFKSLMFGLALSTAVASPAVLAQQYPAPRVNLVTHSSPGGGSDVFLRELIKYLPASAMKTTFTVENVRGGSGAKAMAFVAGAAADGSVFYATTPTHIQVTLMSKPAVGYDALDPIVIVFQDPQVLYTRTESPFKTLTDVINHARANPGKSRWGASNPASEERIAMEKLARAANVKVPIVSHEGGADQMIGVLNGTFDIGIGEPQELIAQIEAGKVRVLASLTDQRLTTMPNVPTAKELGLNVVVKKFRGLSGPKGIPDAAAKGMHDAIKVALDNPEYKATYTKQGLIPSLMTREESRKFINEFVTEVTADLKALGAIQ